MISLTNQRKIFITKVLYLNEAFLAKRIFCMNIALYSVKNWEPCMAHHPFYKDYYFQSKNWDPAHLCSYLILYQKSFATNITFIAKESTLNSSYWFFVLLILYLSRHCYQKQILDFSGKMIISCGGGLYHSRAILLLFALRD